MDAKSEQIYRYTSERWLMNKWNISLKVYSAGEKRSIQSIDINLFKPRKQLFTDRTLHVIDTSGQ